LQGFVAGTVVSVDSDSVTASECDGIAHQIPKYGSGAAARRVGGKQPPTLLPRDSADLPEEGIDDMDNLPQLHE
jgi:hypothetical protein